MLGKPIDTYVTNQIEARQKAYGSGTSSTRNQSQILYQNSPTAWVKLSSGADSTRPNPEGSGIALAKNYVLFGGLSKFQDKGYDSVYKKDSQYGIVPMPGIESIDVQYINNGSLRKATVKIKAYSKDQFEVLNILYMRLGYTMLLEWGNSTYTSNGTDYQNVGATVDFFNLNSTNDVIKAIEAKRKAYNGNYDGLIGRISNFNWNFSEDGSYDLELSIFSLGDLFSAYKINIPASNDELNSSRKARLILLKNKPQDEDYQGVTEKSIEEAANDGSSSSNKISNYLFILKILNVSQIDPLLTQNTTNVDDDGEEVETGTTAREEPLDIQYDISFTINQDEIKIGRFVKYNSEITLTNTTYTDVEFDIFTPDLSSETKVKIKIPAQFTNKDIIWFNYSNGEEPTPAVPEDLGYYMRLSHLFLFIKNNIMPKNDKKEPLVDFQIDVAKDKMYCFPNQISLDPRVCVVNSQLQVIKCFSQLEKWNNGDGSANMMNIYISFSQIHKSLQENIDDKGNIDLYKFFTSICDSLNTALGSVNKLEPILDEDTNILKIVDQNYNPNPQPSSTLITYGYDGQRSTIVRNIDLKTSLTPELASSVAVGSTSNGYVIGKENTMFAKWNRGIRNRFQSELVPADPSTPIDDPVTNYINSFYANGKQALGYKYTSVFAPSPTEGEEEQTQEQKEEETKPELDDKIIDSNISIASEFYRYAQSYIFSKNSEYGSPTQGFIPISLGLTLDGISGIKIFNSLRIDTSFLPKNYSDSLRFIIKAVNHKVSNQDWETTLETLVIPETYKGNSPILSYSAINSNVQSLLNQYNIGAISGKLNAQTGEVNVPQWLKDQYGLLFASPQVFSGGGGLGVGGNSATSWWYYSSWQQGPAGGAEIWKIIKGRQTKFSLVSKAAIADNWPAGAKSVGNPKYTSSDGVNWGNAGELYTSDPKRLATAFAEVQIRLFTEEKYNQGNATINGSGAERTGFKFSEMKAAFEKAISENPNPDLPLDVVVAIGYTENGLNTDTEASNNFQTMFQMGQYYKGKPTEFLPIINKYKKGSPTYKNYSGFPGPGTYQGYVNTFTEFYNFFKEVYPLMGKNVSQFKSISGYPN